MQETQETWVQSLDWEDSVRESFPRQVDRKSRGPQGERGLQMEEIACKCQTFLSLLSSRRKQTSNIFSFSIQI